MNFIGSCLIIFGKSSIDFKTVLEDILKYPSGVNFYMFHGGTTFGFMNGGNVYKTFPYFLPDISSYGKDFLQVNNFNSSYTCFYKQPSLYYVSRL